jgi:8-oxo-dGTP pyrophosphatase MutT (NUDIX family)
MTRSQRPDGVNILLRDRQGRLLMQFRDSAAPAEPLQWDFFGGGMEDDESPEACARRELKEELGIDARPEQMHELFSLMVEAGQQYYFLYLPTVDWGDFHVNEGAGCAFFWPTDIPLLARLQNVKAIADRLAQGKVGFPPQSE